MRLTSFLVAAAAATVASAHSSNYTRCGTNSPSPAQVEGISAAARRYAAKQDMTSTANRKITTYVHVVTSEMKKSNYTQGMVDSQIAVMNEAYAPMGFTFELAHTDFTANDHWAAASDNDDIKAEDMMRSLKQGTYGDLDLYLMSDLGDGRGLLGMCNFPAPDPTAQDIITDGCLIHADTIPGGAHNRYNLGATAVHEIGHWFGLFHVFQGGCDPEGDGIDDTPPQGAMTMGCPIGKDSCPGAGVDSIHNFMDYSDDLCMDRFSPGQVARARAVYDEMRAGK